MEIGGILVNHINNLALFTQFHDFTGLTLPGGIRPSDIDLFLELNGKAVFAGEGKKVGSPLTTGQRRSMESIADNYEKNGGLGVSFVYEHNTPVGQYVIVKDCFVRDVYFHGSWKKVTPNYTVELLLRWFDEQYKLKISGGA